MSVPLIQNFSVTAGDDLVINFDVNPDDGTTLAGATISWRVYAMVGGVPTGPALITKTIANGGITVTNANLLKFAVTLAAADTATRLRNYYHLAQITDSFGKITTPTVGIMTVLEATP